MPRPLPRDFRLRSDFDAGVDWPIGYGDLAPYYDEVERILGVSGPSPFPWGPARGPYPMPPLPLNAPAHLMARGCAPLGIHTAPAAMAIGMKVTSVLPLEPRLQPRAQSPRLLQAWRQPIPSSW